MTWKTYRRTVFLIFAAMCFLARLDAQETFVRDCATRPACTLATGVSWSSGNQIWRFTPVAPSVSLRIWIRNNNTTSAHTSQTVQIWVSDQTSVDATSLTNNSDQWVQAAVNDNATASAKCTSVAANNATASPGANGKGTCFSNALYSAQIAIRITGAASASGSPDTFDIGILQLPGILSGAQPGIDPASTSVPQNTAMTQGSIPLNKLGPPGVPTAWSPFTIGCINAGTVATGATNLITAVACDFFGVNLLTNGQSGSIDVVTNLATAGSQLDTAVDVPGAVASGAGTVATAIVPTNSSASAIATTVSSAVESNHVFKSSAGNLYSVCVTTGATAGFLMIFNATSAPGDGAVTPAEIPVQVQANQTSCLTFNSGPSSRYSTGITAVFSSTGPLTKTASATAVFSARIM